MFTIRRPAFVIASIVLAQAILAAMPATANVYKEFRDWAALCTNGLTCTLGYSTEKPEGLNMVSLRRTSAPNAPVSLVLPIPDGMTTSSKMAGNLEISVDGKKVLNAPVGSLAVDTEQSELALPEDADTHALVEAMKAGQEMRVAYAGAFDSLSVTVPLSGVVAGLLFIDEAQGRLKRTDALVSVGDKAPPAEAAIRDIPSFAEIPAAIRSDFEDETAVCGISPDLFRNLGGFEARLDETYTLLGLPCGAPGAYNALYTFFSVSGDEVTPLALPVIGDGGPTVETSAYNVDYDPAKHRLSAFYKGRGIGDCGTYQVWTLEDRGMGPAFVLKEQRQKGDCDGNYAGGPEKWPRAWPPG